MKTVQPPGEEIPHNPTAEGMAESLRRARLNQVIVWLSPEQLQVINQLIAARAEAARELSILTDRLKKAMALGDAGAYAAAKKECGEGRQRCYACALAIDAALEAFGHLVPPAIAVPPRHPVSGMSATLAYAAGEETCILSAVGSPIRSSTAPEQPE